MDADVDRAHALARDALAAYARGDAEVARSLACEVARAVLGTPLVEAALDTLKGGEHGDARAIALCQALLAPPGTAHKEGGVA